MTPNAFALVLLLTYLSVTLVNWISPPISSRHTTFLTLLLLVVYFVWVIGVPVLTTR